MFSRSDVELLVLLLAFRVGAVVGKMPTATLKKWVKFWQVRFARKWLKDSPIQAYMRDLKQFCMNFFGRLMGDFDNWVSEPEEFIETGDRVIALGYYSAKAQKTGKTFSAKFAHIWTLQDGVILRLQQCADTVQFAHALED